MLVQRAGEVIPQVIGPILTQAAARMPQPYRAADDLPDAAARRSIRPEGEAMARCTGGFAKCVAQRFELLKHFVGRGAMDIESVGEKLAWSLVSTSGLVYDPATCTN